jgi:prolyl 4-hydroxylase
MVQPILRSEMPGTAPRTGERLADYIRVYDEVLPAELCDRMVARFEADAANQQAIDRPGIRRFSVLDVTAAPGWSDIHAILLDQLIKAVGRYAADLETRWLPPNQSVENFRIKRYRPGTGEEFRPHVDVSNADLSHRMLVIFWYLNDVAEGGETEFASLGVAVKPRKGRLLMFPPFFLYPHAGRPPVSNTKYIVGSYTRYE